MKFICDGMLGKLCKYLRLCGIDTTYSNQGMKVMVQAKQGGRILLTRNTLLKDREQVFFLADDDPFSQLKIVLGQFKIRSEIRFFCRCLMCNELLAPVLKEEVKGKVPYYTYRNFNEFAECPKCQRIYWKGSHYANMQKRISETLMKNEEI